MTTAVAFCTLGCKVNQYETEAMKERFAAAGYEIREFSEAADIYIVNTCTVTNIADRKSRQMLHRARKKNPDALIVAVGCYVQTAGEALEKEDVIDIAIGNDLKKNIVDLVAARLADRKQARACYLNDMTGKRPYENLSVNQMSDRTRAQIKIQDGCNQFCSYCIIPYARGRVRSRAHEDILAEVKRLEAAGCKEVVLTGIHISSYGVDFEDRDYRLIDLIEDMAKTAPQMHIHLGSLEPGIVTEDFAERLAGLPQICPHFHLSLQSGCDATLKRMNRRYTSAEYMEKCKLLRKVFDRPSITTDVIVGFPGETEEEFETTRAFLEEIHFADMHIFKYSRRQGTRAAVMPDQVDPQIMAKRSDILTTLAEKMHLDYIQACSGMHQCFLPEMPVSLGGKNYITGYTQNYIRCALSPEGLKTGDFAEIEIGTQTEGEFVFCRKIS